MKSITMLKLLSVFFTALPLLALGYQADSSLEEELATSKNSILQSHETKSAKEIGSNVRWPTNRPSSGYLSKRFSWYDEKFDFYIWVEQGELWAQVVPVVPGVFVCSSSFSIIQNNIQYDTLKLENIAGNSQCGDLFISSIFVVTQWSFYTNKANLGSNFTLIHDSNVIEMFDITYAGSTSSTGSQPGYTSSPKGFVNSNLDIWVPSIIFESKSGPLDIYVDFKFYGTGTRGELLWELENYGVNP